ncbi:MAG: TauD/TfdA family dioxygenase [Pseudonocardiaceae bacterium]
MSVITEDGSRFGDVREELGSLVADAAFEPGRARGGKARALLERDGAVILTGLRAEPDNLVLAAAEMFGTRLRRLYPVRERGGVQDGAVHLHTDSHHVAVNVHGRLTTLRDPDEDYVLIQCVHQAAHGGSSLVVDGYRVVDLMHETHPDLWTFLTTVDVDFYGGWPPQRGVPATPQVCRHVEWTRTGRRIVRANQGARPMPQEPRAEHQEAMLDLFADLRATLAAGAPRVALREGEILLPPARHGRREAERPAPASR